MIIKETYPVAANDMSVAGDVSASIKRQMKRLGIPNQIMRRVSVCTYEAEINLVIHSDGGEIDFAISEEEIRVHVRDVGPGIADLDKDLSAWLKGLTGWSYQLTAFAAMVCQACGLRYVSADILNVVEGCTRNGCTCKFNRI